MSEENIEVIDKFDDFIRNSDLCENIINWYDFKENSTILEIGTNYGLITNYFAKNNFNITSLEIDKEKYESNLNKFKDYQNVKLINESYEEFVENCNNKFDYIICTNTANKIDKYISDKNNINTFSVVLETSRKILNENGVILVALYNKFGIKNFSGAAIEGTKSFDVLSGKINNYLTYSKKELREIIEQNNFKYKFYYPFPDHILPSVIYTDSYMPDENSSKLKYLIYYNPKDTIIFNELDIVKEIVKEEKLDFFSNSYFVEISNDNKKFCKANYVSFNNLRKKENKLITKMYDDFVKKEQIFTFGKGHIESIANNIDILKKCNIDIIDEVKSGKVYSQYKNLPNLIDLLTKEILESNKDKAIELIDYWYNFLKEKFKTLFINKDKIDNTVFDKYNIEITSVQKQKLSFLKYGLFDMIFENIFIELDDKKNINKLYVYDQEWCEQNLPLEFILYRALNNLFYYNSKISNYIDINYFYDKYNITEYIEIFKNLENNIQENLIDNEIRSFYQSTYISLTTIESLKQIAFYANQNTEDIKRQYNEFIKVVEDTNKNWAKELNDAYLKISKLEIELSQKKIKKLT